MGRGRTENCNTSRQVTFCNGLLIKKAYELSAVLFNAVVALTVIFSSRGRLHECANNRFSRPIKMVSLLVMSVVVVLVMAETAASSSTYWAFHCAAGNFTPGSPYSNSLEAVAAILPTRVGRTPLLFASESPASRGGGELYALAQCWRGSSRSVCERCVVAAFRDAQELCRSREGAIVFRDMCTVAYYNKKIEQFPDDPSIGIAASRVDSTQVVIHSSAFEDAVEKLQEAVVHGAAMSPSSYFATGQTEVKTIDLQVTLYAAAQCLPSMTHQDCSICLRKLLDVMQLSAAPDLTPGRVASVWCSYRFSFYHFFSGQPTLTLPAAEPPMGIDRPPASKHSNGYSVPSWAWVAVGAGAAVTTIAVVVFLVFCYKKQRISRQNLPSGEREKTVQLKDRTGDEEAPRVYSGQVESQPSALDSFEEIVQMAKKKEVALFLDYDGTLAPIVRDPERAYMSNEMRGVLQNVANLFRTSVVSGRARDKVFDFVRIKDINYAGSHGMDIKIATSTTEFASTSEIVEEDSYQPAEEYVDMINEVHNFLVNATGEINGANIENNKFCVSLHYRNVAEEDMPHVRQVVDEILGNMKDHVKLTTGHMVFDFVRIKDINYAGSHGMDIKIATSTTEFASTSEIVEEDSYQPAEEYVDMINEVHNFLVNATGEINGANIENNKFCVSLHYRNVAEEDMPHVRQVVDEILGNMKDHVKLTTGHMLNKGDAVLYLLKKLGLGDSFPIYIGDDRTDEDAFKVLYERNDGIGILVAETGRETSAFYSLKDPAQVMDFLKMLVRWKQETEN